MAAPAGWTDRIPITSNPAKIPVTMPDGGVPVFATDFIFQQGGDNDEGDIRAFVDGLAADHSDLVVTQADGETTVPFGVRQFSQVAGSRELNIGMGVASLSSAVGTDFYLYRGCTGGPFENKAGVVPTASGFHTYFTLETVGTASGNPIYLDWTSNAANGLDYVDDADKQGIVGAGQGFDGSNDYIRAPITKPTMPLTISYWVKPNAELFEGVFDSAPSQTYTLRNHERKQIQWLGTASLILDMGNFPTDSWTHVDLVFRFDGNRHIDFYKNGAFIETVDGNTESFYQWNVNEFRIGDINRGGSGRFAGSLDEFQIHQALRSADWITTYYNMTADNDAFWTVGAEEPAGIIVPRHYNALYNAGYNRGFN